MWALGLGLYLILEWIIAIYDVILLHRIWDQGYIPRLKLGGVPSCRLISWL